MSLFYECIICQHANNSIMDLHNHHTQHHNLEELSQTIINLKGFKVWNDMKPIKRKYLKQRNLGDNNNNENVYNNFFIKPILQDNGTYRNEQIINSSRKFGHDNTTCAVNCSQYIAWEHELNKREEINDEEFLDSIESLCYDLSKRKCKRGRKKKERMDLDNADRRNLMQYIENVIGIKTTVVEQPNTESCQIATTSSWNTSNSINNTTINDIHPTQVKNEVIDIEDKKTALLAISETNVNKNVLRHDPLYNNFSWNSIITVNANEQEMSDEERNVYSELMKPNIETFL